MTDDDPEAVEAVSVVDCAPPRRNIAAAARARIAWRILWVIDYWDLVVWESYDAGVRQFYSRRCYRLHYRDCGRMWKNAAD